MGLLGIRKSSSRDKMDHEMDVFSRSGPSLYQTSFNWRNMHHRTTVLACLVQGVYVQDRDRQHNRQGQQALSPPWYDSFGFQLHSQIVDDVDSSIFGAIYELKNPVEGAPTCVIAFRGTNKGTSLIQDLKLDLACIIDKLHRRSRQAIAMKDVQDMVTAAGGSNVVLAGHSLGAAIGMLVGKNMAKMGIFLEAFLFNPPFISAPFEIIKNEKLKHWIRTLGSFITAGATVAVKGLLRTSLSSEPDPFVALSAWVPYLFLNRADHICSGYIGYFKQRNMESRVVRSVVRLAAQNSLGDLFLTAIGSKSVNSEPLHKLPSANLKINRCRSPAHGIRQWWAPDLQFDSREYTYTEPLQPNTDGNWIRGVLPPPTNPHSTHTPSPPHISYSEGLIHHPTHTLPPTATHLLQ